MHFNMLQPELKTAWLWWINCSELKRPTGNECLAIANATPSPGSLQPYTTPGVMSVFFNHLHCRTRTMAQVPTLVAKSLFNTMQLPLSNMKNLFWSCCNYLKQLSPPYASKGAKITQPIIVGYELVMEKVWGCFLNLYYWPAEPAEQSRWSIVIMVTVLSWSRHGCLPPLVLVLQLISSDTVKEHKQAWVVSGFWIMLLSTCIAERERIRKNRADTR